MGEGGGGGGGSALRRFLGSRELPPTELSRGGQRLGKAASFSPARSSVRRRGGGCRSWRRPTLPGLEPRFCFHGEYFCLIECLWIARLCFCGEAQTDRCVARDGAGGSGGLGATCPHHVGARAARSSPVPSRGERSRGAARGGAAARIPAAPAGCFPSLCAFGSEIPPGIPATPPGQRSEAPAPPAPGFSPSEPALWGRG